MALSCKCGFHEAAVSSPFSRSWKKQAEPYYSHNLSSVGALHSCGFGICNWRILDCHFSTTFLPFQEPICRILFIRIFDGCDHCHWWIFTDDLLLHCYQGNQFTNIQTAALVLLFCLSAQSHEVEKF